MVDRQERAEGEGVEEVVQAGVDVRFAGHRLQALTIHLHTRHDATVAKLETRSDREARKILLELTQEFRKHNEELATNCMRLSNSNHGAMELLKKSKDGRAAVTMRRAAELLVKGLANAEEEVHALKTKLKEAEGQRDNYKSLLAKTNSELTSAEAYAQLSMATGQKAASSKRSSAAAGVSAEDAVIMPPPSKRSKEAEKGKSPARQPQQVVSKRGRGTTSTREPEAPIVVGNGLSSRAGPTGNNSRGDSDRGGGVGSVPELRKAAKGKGRAAISLARNKPVTTGVMSSDQESRATNSRSNGNGNTSSGTTPSAVGAEAASGSKANTSFGQRRGAENADLASSGSDDDEAGAAAGNLRGGFDQSSGESISTLGLADPRSLHDKGKASDGVGRRKERGVEVAVAEEGSDGWVAPWQDAAETGSAGGDVSVYDSDDAPSMFF